MANSRQVDRAGIARRNLKVTDFWKGPIKSALWKQQHENSLDGVKFATGAFRVNVGVGTPPVN